MGPPGSEATRSRADQTWARARGKLPSPGRAPGSRRGRPESRLAGRMAVPAIGAGTIHHIAGITLAGCTATGTDTIPGGAGVVMDWATAWAWGRASWPGD